MLMGQNSEDCNMNNIFSIKKILSVWGGLSLLLIFCGLFTLVYGHESRAFLLLLNCINLSLLISVCLGRGKIEEGIPEILERTKNVSFEIKYNREVEVGRLLFSASVFFGICIILLSVFDIDTYYYLIREDGPVEYASSIFWVMSAFIVLFHTIHLSGSKSGAGYQATFNIMLIVFFIICGGEEISWGQRIIGMETPEFVKSVNVQNEINIHNIGSISLFSNLFFLGMVTFFLFIPFFMRKYSQVENVLYFFRFPVSNRFATLVFIVTLVVWIFIGLRFGTLGFHPYSFFTEQYYNQMDDEIFEFFSAYTFLCFSVLHSMKKVSMVNSEHSV